MSEPTQTFKLTKNQIDIIIRCIQNCVLPADHPYSSLVHPTVLNNMNALVTMLTKAYQACDEIAPVAHPVVDKRWAIKVDGEYVYNDMSMGRDESKAISFKAFEVARGIGVNICHYQQPGSKFEVVEWSGVNTTVDKNLEPAKEPTAFEVDKADREKIERGEGFKSATEECQQRGEDSDWTASY